MLLLSCSVVFDSLWPPWAARQASLSFPISRSLLTLLSIESVMPSNRLVLWMAGLSFVTHWCIYFPLMVVDASFHQQWMKVTVSPHFCHSMFLAPLILSFDSMKCHVTCFSCILMSSNEVEHIFTCLLVIYIYCELLRYALILIS